MPKHNNILPDIHLRKHWQKWVKTFFNQPGKKRARLEARRAKAAASFPRPLEKLRPIVSSCTHRYSGKPRIGRGFSLDELKEAGITPQFAKTIGIAVDFRRRNRNVDSLARNVARLNAYKEKLVILPLKAGKVKGARFGQLADSTVNVDELTQNTLKTVLPIATVSLREKPSTVTPAMNKFDAKEQLAREVNNKKWHGLRKKREDEAANQ